MARWGARTEGDASGCRHRSNDHVNETVGSTGSKRKGEVKGFMVSETYGRPHFGVYLNSLSERDAHELLWKHLFKGSNKIVSGSFIAKHFQKRLLLAREPPCPPPHFLPRRNSNMAPATVIDQRDNIGLGGKVQPTIIDTA